MIKSYILAARTIHFVTFWIKTLTNGHKIQQKLNPSWESMKQTCSSGLYTSQNSHFLKECLLDR